MEWCQCSIGYAEGKRHLPFILYGFMDVAYWERATGMSNQQTQFNVQVSSFIVCDDRRVGRTAGRHIFWNLAFHHLNPALSPSDNSTHAPHLRFVSYMGVRRSWLRKDENGRSMRGGSTYIYIHRERERERFVCLSIDLALSLLQHFFSTAWGVMCINPPGVAAHWVITC